MLRVWEIYNTVNNKRYYVANELAEKAMLQYYGEIKYGDLASDIRKYGLDAFQFKEVERNSTPKKQMNCFVVKSKKRRR